MPGVSRTTMRIPRKFISVWVIRRVEDTGFRLVWCNESLVSLRTSYPIVRTVDPALVQSHRGFSAAFGPYQPVGEILGFVLYATIVTYATIFTSSEYTVDLLRIERLLPIIVMTGVKLNRPALLVK